MATKRSSAKTAAPRKKSGGTKRSGASEAVHASELQLPGPELARIAAFPFPGSATTYAVSDRARRIAFTALVGREGAVLDGATGALVAALPNALQALLAPNGERLVLAREAPNRAVLVDANDGKELCVLEGSEGAASIAQTMLVDPLRQQAIGFCDRAIGFWDLDTGRLARRVPSQRVGLRVLLDDWLVVAEEDVTPQGKSARVRAISLLDDTIETLLDRGALLARLDGRRAGLACARPQRPDELATTFDHLVFRGDTRALDQAGSIDGGPWSLETLATEERVVLRQINASPFRVEVLDLKNVLKRFDLPHPKQVLKLVELPSARALATLANDGGVRLWSLETGGMTLLAKRAEAWFGLSTDHTRLVVITNEAQVFDVPARV